MQERRTQGGTECTASFNHGIWVSVMSLEAEGTLVFAPSHPNSKTKKN
jgi:hypothetical protein